MMRLILSYFDKSLDALQKGAKIDDLAALPVRERIGRYKYQAESGINDEYDAIITELDREIADALEKTED